MANLRNVALVLALVWCCGCEKAEESAGLTEDDQAETPQVLPGDRDETSTSGDWTYVYAITNPGSRSQGCLGKLSFAGKPVPRPLDPTDFYDTPLGRFVYHPMVGDFPFGQADQIMLWDPQGWMRVEPSGTPPIGKALPWPDKVQSKDLKEQARQQMKQMIQGTLSQGGLDDAFLEKDDAHEPDNPKDPWGTPYKTFSDFRGGEGGGKVVRLIMTSAGPDQKFDTADDIKEHSNFVSASPSNGVDILGELQGMTESTMELESMPEE